MNSEEIMMRHGTQMALFGDRNPNGSPLFDDTGDRPALPENVISIHAKRVERAIAMLRRNADLRPRPL